jgi:hypothetical protein
VFDPVAPNDLANLINSASDWGAYINGTPATLPTSYIIYFPDWGVIPLFQVVVLVGPKFPAIPKLTLPLFKLPVNGGVVNYFTAFCI